MVILVLVWPKTRSSPTGQQTVAASVPKAVRSTVSNPNSNTQSAVVQTLPNPSESIAQPTIVNRPSSIVENNTRPTDVQTRPIGIEGKSAEPSIATPSHKDFRQPSSQKTSPEEQHGRSVEAKRLLTGAERSFFWTLQDAIKSDYLIFPQIPLRQLVGTQTERNIPNELRGMLWNGIADYVLANPSNLNAMAVIELDDSSHNYADAKARDLRKDAFVQQYTGIPLLRCPSKQRWNTTQIRHQIDQIVSPGYTRDFMDSRECSFFQVMREAKNDYLVFPKVSLKQLTHRKDWLSEETFKALENEVVDFVLCHPRFLSTLLAIEVNKTPMNNHEKQLLLEDARIPLLFLDSPEKHNAAAIRRKIQVAIKSNESK